MSRPARRTVGGRTATIRRLSAKELRALPVHALAGLFRPLEGDELAGLRESVRTLGYDESEPLVVWERTGELVDGRNRREVAVALRLADVPVAFVKFTNAREVADYVTAANIIRRHLTNREKAQLAKRLAHVGLTSDRIAARLGIDVSTARRHTTAEREEAKARRDAEVQAAIAAGKSQRQAARELGISKGTVQNVDKNGRSPESVRPPVATPTPKRGKPPTLTVPVDSADAAIRKLAERFTLAELEQALASLASEAKA